MCLISLHTISHNTVFFLTFPKNKRVVCIKDPHSRQYLWQLTFQFWCNKETNVILPRIRTMAYPPHIRPIFIWNFYTEFFLTFNLNISSWIFVIRIPWYNADCRWIYLFWKFFSVTETTESETFVLDVSIILSLMCWCFCSWCSAQIWHLTVRHHAQLPAQWPEAMVLVAQHGVPGDSRWTITLLF